MPRYVAFLRGINLGKRRVKMERLREAVAAFPGSSEVDTFIASGNVLFTSPRRAVAALENELAAHLATELGFPVPVLLRTRRELADLVATAPLGELWADAPNASTQVTFFREPLPAQLAAGIVEVRTEVDAFAVKGRELYWRCGVKLTASTVWADAKANPHHLPVGTTRNLNTLRQIVEKFPDTP